jgi:SRSO17 transposase
MNVPEDRIRRFISQSPWPYKAAQEQLHEMMPTSIAVSEAMLVVDDVDIRKQGDHSVGVTRQYAGSIGKVDNCQVAVDLVSAVPDRVRNADQVTWPLGMELYLPRQWVEDESYAGLREEVGLPAEVGFKKKPELAAELVEQAQAGDVPHACVGADAGYGDNTSFRKTLRELDEPYILGITPSELRLLPEDTPLEPPGPTAGRGRPRTYPRYSEEVEPLTPERFGESATDWTEVTWSEGSKDTLTGTFSRHQVRVVSAPQHRRVSDERGWLLLEDHGDGYKAWLCWGVDDWSLERLVTYAHLRWTIEQFHKDIKQVLGLDQFEGRTWTGWNHHSTMVLLTYAFLMTERTARGADARLPPIPQVARAMNYEMIVRTIHAEGVESPIARRVAEAFLCGYTDW